MTHPPQPSLTDRVRAWLRTDVPWPAVLGAGVGVSTVALLSVAGLSPLLAAVAAGAVARPELIQWVTDFGGNTLAGWVGNLAADASAAPFRDDQAAADPAQIAALAQQLQQRAEADAALAGELAKLLTEIQAVPSALAGLRSDLADIGEEVGAQSELLIAQQTLLSGLQADVQGIAQNSAELQSYIEATLRSESDRVISALTTQTQRLEVAGDANTARSLASIDTLRNTLRTAPQVNIDEGAQVGEFTIHGDIVGRDLINNFITHLPPATPPPYRMAVERMAEDYGVIFGGRDVELAKLDAWLTGDARPFAFLHAPTGRGKTALLIHWVARVQQRGDWHVIFVPISLRYQTATAASALGALAAALAGFHGELYRLSTIHTYSNDLPFFVAEYLRRTPSNNRQLLIVIDGLDEAIGWEINPIMFPHQPGAYLRIVASARERAHMSLNDWLTQLGWEGQTCDLGLEGLNQAAVSDVLRRMGNPLDALATDVDLLSEIARVSQGDPLTIRYLVEALKDGSLSPGKLKALTPGLESFVRVWLDELVHHSANAGTVYALLSLCAVALGPLTADDVNRLEPTIFQLKTALNQAAKTVGRFVIGDGSQERGYVFGHTRLRELYLEKFLYNTERDAALQRFVEDGRRWYAERTGAAPAYIRQFWVTHLAQAGQWELATQVVTGVEEAAQGHRQAWAQLRYAAEGSYSGYLSDLDVIWQRADAISDVALSVRCALIVATVRSLSGNISPELLYQLVTVGTPEGKWSIAAALEVVRQMPEDRHKAEAITKLAPLVPEHAVVWVLDVAKEIVQEEHLKDALIGISQYLSDERLAEGFAIAEGVSSEAWRAIAMVTLAFCNSTTTNQQVLQAKALDALISVVDEVAQILVLERDTVLVSERTIQLPIDVIAKAKALSHPVRRAYALAILTQYLSMEDVEEALKAIKEIENMRLRSIAIRRLIKSCLYVDDVLEKIYEIIQDFEEVLYRDSAFMELLRRLLPSSQFALGQVVIVYIGAITDRHRQAVTLAGFAPSLPVPLLKDALVLVEPINDAWDRKLILEQMAHQLPAELFSKALELALGITDRQLLVHTLATIVSQPNIDNDVKQSILKQIFVMLSEINDIERIRVLARITLFVTSELADTVRQLWCDGVTIINTISDAHLKAQVLRELADHWPTELLAEVFAIARTITDHHNRGETLTKLARRLPGHEQPAIVSEILAGVSLIGDEELCKAVQEALRVDNSGREMATDQMLLSKEGDYEAVLLRIREMGREWERAKELAAILPGLPVEYHQQALDITQTIKDELSKSDALFALAKHISHDHLPNILLTTSNLLQGEYRNYVFTALAPRLAEHPPPLSTWQETLHILARNGRPALLSDLKALTPWLVALATPEQRAEVAQAIVDVCKAWP